MKPGRELDALVAEKVMGRKLPTEAVYFPGEVPSGPVHLCPFYSTDIAAAWSVVEKLMAEDRAFHLYTPKHGPGFEANFNPPNIPDTRSAHTAPLAICLAALRAVGA